MEGVSNINWYLWYRGCAFLCAIPTLISKGTCEIYSYHKKVVLFFKWGLPKTFLILIIMLSQNVYEGHPWVKRIKYKSSKNNIFGNVHSPQIITVHSKTILYSTINYPPHPTKFGWTGMSVLQYCCQQCTAIYNNLLVINQTRPVWSM